MKTETNINLIDINRVSRQWLNDWFVAHAKNLGIEVLILEQKDQWCFASLRYKKIELSKTGYTKRKIVFAFFHEIGHFEAIKEERFNWLIDEHREGPGSLWGKYYLRNLSKEEEDRYRKETLEMERWCDTYGEQEALKFFKNPDCYKPYHREPGHKSYGKTLEALDYLLKQIPEETNTITYYKP